MRLETLKRLTEIHGVSGFESPVASEMGRSLEESLGSASIDRIGNVIGTKVGSGVGQVAILAHMDQVGLMVSKIEPDGMLRSLPIGHVEPSTLVGRAVLVLAAETEVEGIVEASAAENPKFEDLVINAGICDADGARRAGIQIGAPVVYDGEFRLSEQSVTSRALDNRVGCAILLELAANVSRPRHTLHFVGTVREEVGFVGATSAAASLEPDFVIVVDVTYANDDRAPNHESLVSLGGGPTFTMRDEGMIGYPQVVDLFASSASAAGVPYQIEVVECGASEASRAQWAFGVPSVGIFIPARNNHTPEEVVHLKDIDWTYELLAMALERDLLRSIR